MTFELGVACADSAATAASGDSHLTVTPPSNTSYAWSREDKARPPHDVDSESSSRLDGEPEHRHTSAAHNLSSDDSRSEQRVRPSVVNEDIDMMIQELSVGRVDSGRDACCQRCGESESCGTCQHAGDPPTHSKTTKHVALCLLGCFTTMGCRTAIVRRMAFHPPQPGYVIRDHRFYWTPAAQLPPGGTAPGWPAEIPLDKVVPPHSPVHIQFKWLKTSKRNMVATLVLTNRDAYRPGMPGTGTGASTGKPKSSPTDAPEKGVEAAARNPCIIFSHGNATDIGGMLGHFYRLCLQLRVTIVGYDYSGYGRSTGRSSERNTFADIRACYKFVRTELKVPWDRIIVYGQSLGSGPSCEVASSKKTPVGGLVLHSAISSGLRLLFEDMKTSPWYDVFKNVEKLPHVTCPTFIVHGELDSQVSIRHAKALHAAALQQPAASRCLVMRGHAEAKDEEKIVQKWWVPLADHNNIEELEVQEFYRHLDSFLALVAARSQLGQGN
eukprot:Selendium_serpulae@DN4331_c0_g1_i2.p1